MKPTQEQVIAWAREAGDCLKDKRGREDYFFDSYGIKQFATLAYEAGRKDENEEIAVEFDKRHEAVKHRNNYFLHAANYVRARMTPLQRLNKAAEDNGEEL